MSKVPSSAKSPSPDDKILQMIRRVLKAIDRDKSPHSLRNALASEITGDADWDIQVRAFGALLRSMLREANADRASGNADLEHRYPDAVYARLIELLAKASGGPGGDVETRENLLADERRAKIR